VTGLLDMVVEVEHRFAAAPEQVFALLSDVEAMAGLGPEHEQAIWTDASRTAFTGRNRMGDAVWEVPCFVVEDSAPTRFAWTVGPVSSPSATWSYDLWPDGDGTLVRQRFAHGPGPTYLRGYVEQHPDRAERAIAGRAEMLRANMLTVLAAADARLRSGRP
jgi:hypothetical protein